MNYDRIFSEAYASWNSFLRRKTAVFFTFLFPIILVSIFGFLVETQTSGLFSKEPVYYVASYISIVVLFTPLSRMSVTVARGRTGSHFEKLSTTPLTKIEWLLAHSIMNFILVLISSILVLFFAALLTDFSFTFPPLLILFIFLGSIIFCNIGAILGSITESQDGAIAASNAIGLPLLFLSDTFIPLDLLPNWAIPFISISPLTPFARGSRDLFMSPNFPFENFQFLLLLVVITFLISSKLLPWNR